MKGIRRQWTPETVHLWTREDLIAGLLSVLTYLLLILGSALALLAQPRGFLLLLIGLATALLMFYVIDPKLRSVSSEYESNQKEYLQRIERITRWEKD